MKIAKWAYVALLLALPIAYVTKREYDPTLVLLVIVASLAVCGYRAVRWVWSQSQTKREVSA